MFIPIILTVISLFLISVQYQKTGDIVQRDVTLKGGVTATIYTDHDYRPLEERLKSELGGTEVIVRKLSELGSDVQTGIIIEVSDIEDDQLKSIIQEELSIVLTADNYTTERVGSSLGESFYKQMLTAIVLAFLFMGIVIFISFRSVLPSFAVIFAAFSDIVMTIAVLNLLNIRISTAGVAALLLLIGYSIDTDVVLSTRVLKRKESSLDERVKSSLQTGLTMTFTTIVALSLGYFFSNSPVLQQMFLIVIIGLFFDLINTWMMNLGLLLWYVKKKNVE